MGGHQRLWSFTRATFCRFLSSKFRFELEDGSDPEPSPPFIVVSNHGNFFDPWILGTHQAKALHIMMNDDGFRSGAISRWYLNGIGAFAKKKGATDLKAMKNTLSFLKKKEPVLIFPEGQATWDGETQPIYGGIERMIKRAKCPLVVFRIKGGFLSKPWWSSSSRKGRISIRRTVYTVDRLAKLDPPAILQIVLDGIYNNDIDDQDNLAVPFHGKNLAKGLERLLWSCPVCGAVDKLVTEGDFISCSSCSSSSRVDAHCHLHPQSEDAEYPDHIHRWHHMEKARALSRIENATDGEILCENDGVSMYEEDEDGHFTERGQGTLTLEPTEISFSSPRRETRSWPVEDLSNYVIQKKDVFEFTHGGSDYRFDLTGGSPMKWLVYVRYLRGWKEVEEKKVI